MKQIIVDVRENDEYSNEHIVGSINLPMSKFQETGCKELEKYKDQEIIILCRSGNRAKMVSELIDTHCSCNVRVYEGGLIERKKQGNETKKMKKFYIPILRQVQIIAGGIVLIGIILAYTINPHFMLLSGFVGGGLFIAGLTGTCLLAEIIAKFPFNKN